MQCRLNQTQPVTKEEKKQIKEGDQIGTPPTVSKGFIPNEIALQILLKADPKNAVRFFQTNKYYSNFGKDEKFWKKMCKQKLFGYPTGPNPNYESFFKANYRSNNEVLNFLKTEFSKVCEKTKAQFSSKFLALVPVGKIAEPFTGKKDNNVNSQNLFDAIATAKTIDEIVVAAHSTAKSAYVGPKKKGELFNGIRNVFTKLGFNYEREDSEEQFKEKFAKAKSQFVANAEKEIIAEHEEKQATASRKSAP